jgi:DNA-binding MarR family transcriptional regulator
VTRTASLRKFAERLRECVVNRRWEEAHQARDRLIEIALHALIDRERDQVELVKDALGKAYGLMRDLHDVDLDPQEMTAQTAMLAAESRVAGAALDMLAADPGRLTPSQRGVKNQILVTLFETNQPHLSNTELAEKLNKPLETVTRALVSLRYEALTEHRREGRSVANWLTDAGKDAARRLLTNGNGGPVPPYEVIRRNWDAAGDLQWRPRSA